MCPLTFPFSARSTPSVTSVHILPSMSTAVVLSTWASTMSGDFAMSCSSVGRTMVVALAAAAPKIMKTHESQYAGGFFVFMGFATKTAAT